MSNNTHNEGTGTPVETKTATPRDMSGFIKAKKVETRARFDAKEMSKAKLMTIEKDTYEVRFSIAYSDLGIEKPDKEDVKEFYEHALNGILQHKLSGAVRSGQIKKSDTTFTELRESTKTRGATKLNPLVLDKATRIAAKYEEDEAWAKTFDKRYMKLMKEQFDGEIESAYAFVMAELDEV